MKIHLKSQKQRSDEKMVSCDAICGTDEKLLWYAFPPSPYSHPYQTICSEIKEVAKIQVYSHCYSFMYTLYPYLGEVND